MASVLFIYLNTLYPTDSGSKRLSSDVITYLCSQDNDVDVLSVVMGQGNRVPTDSPIRRFIEIQNPVSNMVLRVLNKLLNLVSRNPIEQNRVIARILRSKITKILDENYYDHIVVNYVQWAKIVPESYWNKTILFSHDILYQRIASLDNLSIDHPKIKAIKRSELEILAKMRRVWCVADYEINELKATIDPEKLRYIGAPQKVRALKAGANKKCLAFIGAAAQQNSAALKYFIDQYYDDEMGLAIAGSVGDMPEIKSIATTHDSISLVGRIEDLDSFYSEYRYIIAPLISGSGIKIKVLEALSYGKIVLATRKALEGIHVSHKIHCIVLDEFDSGVELMAFLADLSPEEEAMISRNAHSFIKEDFSPDVLFKGMLE